MQWGPQGGGLMQRPLGYLGAGGNSCCLLTYVNGTGLAISPQILNNL